MTRRPSRSSDRARILGPLRALFAGTPPTTALSAGVFVALAVVLAVVPVPYVTWSPGPTTDLLGPGATGKGQAVAISGLPTYPTHGQLRLTTVSVTPADGRVTLPAALVAHWLPGREVLPRAAVYPPGTTEQQSVTENTRTMDTAQQSAVVAGLRSAGVRVTPVPMVTGVTTGAPADGRLEPGDAILKVDGRPVTTPDQAVAAIRAHAVGQQVTLTVKRQGRQVDVVVPTRAAPDDPKRPVIGATVATGYDHPGTVTFGIPSDIGGPSAGLAFALAIHDRLTPQDLTAGRVVAATGTIADDGTVGSIGGLESKVRGVEDAGAVLFLIPRGNCAEADTLHADIPLVPVDSLGQAVDVLSHPATPPADLPHCS